MASIMNLTDKYCYYSRYFNIICKTEGKHPATKEVTYQLEVIKGDDLIDLVTGLVESELKQALADLKTKTYLNI